jgi:hypothetical protein
MDRVTRFSTFALFSQTIPCGPLIHGPFFNSASNSRRFLTLLFLIFVHVVSLKPNASCIRCQWQGMHHAWSVNDKACIMHGVSLTPHANFIKLHSKAVSPMIFNFAKLFENFICMRCHWPRNPPAWRVNVPACIVHAVSMTPHASCMRCQWHLMLVHAESMAPHAYKKFRIYSRIRIYMQKSLAP